MEIFQPVKPIILIVDDAPANLSLMAGLLKEVYTVKALNAGSRVLALARQEAPDLILLDVMMPDMDGYEVCRQLKADPVTRQIPVIFVTSMTDAGSEQRGMAVGAVDYIMRPITPAILLSRVQAHVVNACAIRTVHIDNQYLQLEVAEQTRQIASLQEVTILALASLAETRDADTGNHLKRTQQYVELLCNCLSRQPRFETYLSAERIRIVALCAPLHDIGKVGVPDRILLNPGRYKPEEFEIMKTHPRLGLEAIAKAQASVHDESELFEVAKEIVYSHHEKWDGSGYPQGLRGEEIPIPARLMALADVYDALICRRVYKPGLSHGAAVQIIVEGRGTHFDPDVVDAFLALSAEFNAVAQRFADTEADWLHKASYSANAVLLSGT
jgi:putative two-component system response regulator